MEQLLYKKPCMIIALYENMAGNKALGVLKEMVMNSGGYNAGKLLIKNEYNYNPVNTKKNEEKIKKAGKQLIEKIKKNKAPVLSKLYTKIAVNIFLKPFVFRDKENNKGIIDSWIENKIINAG